MLKDSKNIEDIFKKTFDGFKVETDPEIFNSVQKKLWIKNFNKFFKDFFTNYKVKPGPKIWSNIQFKLWLKHFFSFNISNFNFYYLLLIASSITGLILFTDIFTNKEDKSFKKNIITQNKNINNVNKNIELKNKISPKKQQLNTVKSNISDKKNTINNEHLRHNNNRQFKKNKTDNNNLQKNNTNKKTDISKNTTIDKNIIDNSSNINNGENNNKPSVTDFQQSKNITKAKKSVDSKEQINKIVNNINSKEQEVNNQKTDNKTQDENIDKSNKSDVPISKKNDETPPIIANSEEQNNKNILKEKDIVNIEAYKDTICKNALGEYIIIETTKWSMDIYFSPLYNKSILSCQLSENTNYVNLVKNAESPALSYSFGVNINYSFKNFLFQTGISYTNLGDNFKAENINIDIDSTSYYDYNHSGYYNLDTIGFNDSIPIIDSTWIDVIVDSTLITEYDSNLTKTPVTILNKYTYLEIPVIFGYEFKRKKITYSLKGGLITGFLLNAKGKTISLIDNTAITDFDKNSLPFLKTNFTLLFAFGISYNLNTKINLFAEPYYRHTVGSMFNKNYEIYRKHYSFGLKLGIRYVF